MLPHVGIAKLVCFYLKRWVYGDEIPIDHSLLHGSIATNTNIGGTTLYIVVATSSRQWLLICLLCQMLSFLTDGLFQTILKRIENPFWHIYSIFGHQALHWPVGWPQRPSKRSSMFFNQLTIVSSWWIWCAEDAVLLTPLSANMILLTLNSYEAIPLVYTWYAIAMLGPATINASLRYSVSESLLTHRRFSWGWDKSEHCMVIASEVDGCFRLQRQLWWFVS